MVSSFSFGSFSSLAVFLETKENQNRPLFSQNFPLAFALQLSFRAIHLLWLLLSVLQPPVHLQVQHPSEHYDACLHVRVPAQNTD
jgi:hypothetical protein